MPVFTTNTLDLQVNCNFRITVTDLNGASTSVETGNISITPASEHDHIGSIVMDNMSPSVGDVLTGSLVGFNDADGIVGGTLSWRLETGIGSDGYSEVATGSTYTVPTGSEGRRILLAYTYTESDGDLRTPDSGATNAITSSVALPSISYSHEIDFEDHPDEGITAAQSIIDWNGINRDSVPNAKRIAAYYNGSGIYDDWQPHVSTDWSRNGTYSIKHSSQAENANKSRSANQFMGNTSEGVDRLAYTGIEYWFGFSMMIVDANAAAGWELLAQVGNNNPAGGTWGPTMNPQFALLRESSGLRFVHRVNRIDGTKEDNFVDMGTVTPGESIDIIMHFKVSNPEPYGFLEVWQRNGNGSLVKYVDVHNTQIGYHHEDTSNGGLCSVCVYQGDPLEEGRTVYFDEIRRTNDPNATLAHVDPASFA